MKRITVFLLCLLLLALALPAAAEDETVYCDGYEYVPLPDGTARIVNAFGVYSTDVAIPSELDGLAVTEIGDGAFSDQYFASVTIPAGVRSIGARAFSDSAGIL